MTGQHFGTLGRKLSRIEATCYYKGNRKRLDHGGWRTCYRFETDDGLSILTWFKMDPHYANVEPDVGTKYQIVFGARSFSEFNGRAETVIERVQLFPCPSPTPSDSPSL